MSLERKDVRFKLNADTHTQLKAICDLEEIEISDFVEAVLVPVIAKRVHDAIALTDRLQRAGVSGNPRSIRGVAGK